MTAAASVVLLHGIWMPDVEMMPIRRRLETRHGFDCRLFGYPSVRGSLDDNAARLAGLVRTLDAERIDYVGHSLGGIVALRMLATIPDLRPGRLVCLGSPLCGSKAARSLYSRRWGRAMLGQSLPAATVQGVAADWCAGVTSEREIGVVAGCVSAGLGRFFAAFDEDNDGSVAVAETRLPGLRDHIVLSVSHTGMLFSGDVADQAAHFLRNGEFQRAEPARSDQPS